MQKSQPELVRDVAEAAYNYGTERRTATWDGKRPALKWQPTQLVSVHMCSAHSRWAIFAIHGRVAVSCDGFQVRANRRAGGGLWVVVGDGNFVLPPDDSCSHHSLSLRASEGARLVNVSSEEGPWGRLLPLMAEDLTAATDRLRTAIARYDEEQKRLREQSRTNDLMDAALAVM